jgi:endonuclease/exonuclease/phosphatase family metal-dependent hydrolase
MKRIFIIILLITASCYLKGQVLPSAKNSHTVVFYNVGKLFDAVNDPGIFDDDFLPEGKRQWTEERYKKKIADVARVLSVINENELPAIIGLVEVENQKVVEDIVTSSKLRHGKYGIILFDSKDEKGLETALLYKKDEIGIVDSKSIPVEFGFDIKDVTRNILYIKCKIKDDNIYHIFVTQWPLRQPNEQDTEIKRISAAVALRKEVDKILNFENNAHIIIMGDFNDEPTNKSTMQILNATNKRKNLNYRDLYNLMYDPHNIGNEGTAMSGSGWVMFDQIIVSPAVFNKSTGYYLTFDDGKVYKGEEVLITDPQTKLTTPNRTYNGNQYLGGVSSHLPVYVILKKDEK